MSIFPVYVHPGNQYESAFRFNTNWEVKRAGDAVSRQSLTCPHFREHRARLVLLFFFPLRCPDHLEL